MPSVGRRQTLTALLLATLMVSAPLLTIQAAKLNRSAELAEENAPSHTAPLPDCEIAEVKVSEVYPDNSGWLELHNSGSSGCDLGGWHIFDENTFGNQNDGLLFDNGTNISSNEHIQFNYSSDFGFYINSYSDTIHISTRGVTMENASVAVEWDLDSRDGYYWDDDRDGSFELCEASTTGTSPMR